MTGAVILQSDFQGRYPNLLDKLGLGSVREAGLISIQAATRGDFEGTAVGFYHNATLLINHFLPYDCSHQPDQITALDQRLASLSRQGQILCYFLDETSMSFGFSVFQNGERVRGRKVDPQGIYSDFGSALPPESGFEPDSRDDSERIMAITKAILGQSLNRLIIENHVTLTAYVDEAQPMNGPQRGDNHA